MFPWYLRTRLIFLLSAFLLVASNAQSGELTVSWTDNSTTEDGFQVERKTGTTGSYSQIATVGANTTSYTDTGLTGGSTYCYHVRAFNSAGTSSYSNEACGVVPTTNFSLSVVKSGTGTGTVTSAPAGITCGQSCSGNFSSGAQVTLTAAADQGSVFSGWSGGGCSGTGSCTVTLNTNITVTATFTIGPIAPQNYTLSVSKAGTGTGSVSSNPAGIVCGTTCSASFASGTQVKLTAIVGDGSVFSGWSGGGCSGTGTCTVTLTANTQVTATFTRQTQTPQTFY
jgi:hypothetical protein